MGFEPLLEQFHANARSQHPQVFNSLWGKDDHETAFWLDYSPECFDRQMTD